MGLTSALSVGVSAKLVTPNDLGEAVATITKAYSAALTDGALAGQANRMWSDQRTLAASITEDLDLAGVLIDPLGSTVTFARVKALIISAAALNTNNVVVGGASATQFVSPFGGATHTLTVRPGATLALIAGSADATGYVTAAGASDLLKIANSAGGTPVTYDIIVIGCAT